MRIAGAVALVTGASSGIGREAARRLAEAGATVVAHGRDAGRLAELSRLTGATTIIADLAEPAEVQRIAATALEAHGRVDILVNNAGSARTGEFLKLDDEAWLADWTLKFFGYVRMARAVLPEMAKHHAGVIVNVIGAAALNPRAGYMIGGAANAALNHFTKALAEEGAPHGVRVVGINRGPILTERLLGMFGRSAEFAGKSAAEREAALGAMTPLGRVGQPEEVADLVAFLASERAAFIHGANVTIDGDITKGLMG
jgi:NAD(P)-dependent dehydrogenase (short-subunit alcohol dehydrogenase family)